MADTPETEVKTETTQAPTPEAAPAAEGSAKKATTINVDELTEKGKAGLNGALAFIDKLFAEDLNKGILYSQIVDIVFVVLAILSGNALGIILSVVVGAVGFMGLASIKKKLFPKQ